MYPGYQFGQQPFQQNPIMGQLPPMMGGQQQLQQMLPMLGQMQSGAIPQGGLPDPASQGLQQPQQHGHHGFLGQMSPLFGIAGMLANHGKLGQFAPMLGGLLGFGLSKSGLFK